MMHFGNGDKPNERRR